MRRLFGGISDEGLAVAIPTKTSPQCGVAPSRRGTTEDMLVLGHGISSDVLAMLVLTGLATVVTETLRAHRSTIKIQRMRVTDTGRRAIGD